MCDAQAVVGLVRVRVRARVRVRVRVGVRVLGLGLGVRGRMVTWKMASIASKKESKLTRGGLSSSKSHMHEGELSAVACSAPAWG